MMEELAAIFARHQQGGGVKVVYETKMYVGQIGEG
jgi:hypothetical protein